MKIHPWRACYYAALCGYTVAGVWSVIRSTGAKERYPRYNVEMGTHPEHNRLFESREADLDA
jgi:hypothetical protein